MSGMMESGPEERCSPGTLAAMGGGGEPGLLWVGLYDLTSSFKSSCGVVEKTVVCACVCTLTCLHERERECMCEHMA